MEVTFELSCCKHPRATELHKEWDLNRESLLAYMEKASLPLNTKGTTAAVFPLFKSNQNKSHTTKILTKCSLQVFTLNRVTRISLKLAGREFARITFAFACLHVFAQKVFQ